MITSLVNLFVPPKARSLAEKELEEAKRRMLQHQSASHYHAKMAEHHQDTILRLSRFIQNEKQ